MADLTITPAQVKPVGVPASDTRFIATGVIVNAGDLLYIDTTVDQWRPGKASGTVEEAEATHIASSSGAEGQALVAFILQQGLVMDLGSAAGVAVGTLYMLSANAGRHMPAADLASTNWSTYVGTGLANNQVLYNANPSGVQVP